ncbi:RHS repeat-associated core domain-containing protein [Nonomuraea sp. B12E4]|uniref:RHS repeat-associated core domain-containing protein n=1 Tax=Nonomuraea sp. B12E4 TaxID=3153564 RepID=UPI00325CA695
MFDEGKPSSATNYHLITTATTDPLVLDGTATPATADKRVTKYDYDPIKSGDMSGWTLRLATSVTTDMPDQPDIVQRARYDTAGREIESRMPASSGNDAGTTVTLYYTAGAHPSSPACGNKPEWAGWFCRTEAAAQPADGKPAIVSTHTHTYYGTMAASTMTSGSATRTTTRIYDAAGRIVRNSLIASSAAENGVPIPETTITYDPATGLEIEKIAGTDKITKGYDSLGRPTSYTDATGNTATATYTIDGQIATTNDGKGSVTFSYNGVDAQGRQERRGLLTKVEAGGVGTFTGAYDADKQLTLQTFPNGMAGVSRYDNAGRQSSLTYTKNESTWLQFSALRDIEGRIGSQTSPGGSEQKYSYDAAGRLLSVRDRSDSCTTRVYGFDLNSNRTSLSTYPADETGQCSTSTSAQTEQYTYDTMDRITGAGYSYDGWGRTTQVPAAHVSGGGDLSVGYFANDLVASITQAGETSTFTLDPSARVKTLTKTGGPQAGTVTHHYAGSEDSPAWITEADGSWTRNIIAFSGLNAYHRSDGSSALLLANLHGDVVAEVENSSSATSILHYTENSEYGVKQGDTSGNDARYGWLGSKQRSSDAPAGLILMGVRVYNPMTGRFLQVDPMPGGSANAYEYCSARPGESDGPLWDVRQTAVGQRRPDIRR